MTESPTAVDPLEPWPDDLTWRGVSPRLIWIREAGIATTAIVLAAGCLGVAAYTGSELPLWGAGAVVGIGIWYGLLAARYVRSWGYAERDEDLLVRHGRLVRRLSIVPYARMQFVDVTAGPLERLLGLATVTLHTAAAASDARVPGLPGPEAARLRDRLAALGEQHAEGL